MKMIVLNGPPRSGKDTFLKLMKAVFMDDLPTDTFVPFSYKHTLCAGVAKRYNLTAQYVWELNANTLTKDVKYDMFGGKSVRECLIYESEEVIKKEHGENGVATQTFKDLQISWMADSNIPLDDCVIATPDGGFESEMQEAMDFFGIERKDILLIRFYRDGCTFDGDSRSYISNPDMEIHNNSDKIHLTKYLRSVEIFMLGEVSNLTEFAKNVLFSLAMDGPSTLGEVYSRRGLIELVKKGFAFKRQKGDFSISLQGIDKFKALEWRGNVPGSDILTVVQEQKLRTELMQKDNPCTMPMFSTDKSFKY